MKELEIKYEMTFTCDEWLIECINRRWKTALDQTKGTETEEEIFEIVLDDVLFDKYFVSSREREAIIYQRSHEIYRWWKENK